MILAHPDGQPAPPQRVLIAANPYSGRRANRRFIDRLCTALETENIAADVVWTPTDRDAALRRPDLAQIYATIIAAGGDGTVDSVLPACRALPLAMYPMGNENLFARQFGYRRNPQTLARAIARRNLRRIDLGQVGAHPFAVVVSAGFDAAVVHAVAAWRAAPARGGLQRVNHLSYVLPLCRTLGRYDFPPLTLRTDEGTEVRGSHALVFNAPQYALGLRFTPQAEVDDGLLDWIVFQEPGTLRSLNYTWLVLRGLHLRRKDVQWGRCRQLRLTAVKPLPIQADGDAIGFTPMDVCVQAQALQLIDMRPTKVTGLAAGSQNHAAAHEQEPPLLLNAHQVE